MKTLKDLTPQIRKRIPEYINSGIEGVFDGVRYKNFNIDAAQKAVNWNYNKCGYRNPVLIVAENIYELQLIYNYIINDPVIANMIFILYKLKNNMLTIDCGQLRSQLDSQLRSQFYNQLDSQLRSQLDSQLRSQLRSQLDSQLDSLLRSQLRSQLCSQLRSQLDSQLDSQLRSQLDSQLRSQFYNQHDVQAEHQSNYNCSYVYSYLFTLDVYSDCYYQCYKFLKDEFKIPLTIEDEFETCFKLQQESGIYSAIFTKLVCIVSKYPKEIKRNRLYQLHSESTSAVVWGSLTPETTYGCYYWNGINVPAKLIEHPDKITKKDILSIENAEIRRCFMEKLGARKYYDIAFNGIIEIDSDIDDCGNKMYLYETKQEDDITNKKVQFLEVTCPSTKRVYNIFPPNQTSKNVWEAKASTFNNEKIEIRHGDVGLLNLNKKYIKPIKET